MGINIDAESDSSVACCQVGDENKLIFQIEDRRQIKQLQIETSGKGKVQLIQIQH